MTKDNNTGVEVLKDEENPYGLLSSDDDVVNVALKEKNGKNI